jgi:hypothetical protein
MAVSVCHSWRGNGLIDMGLYMTVFFLSCFIVCLYHNVRYLSMRMFIDLLRVELLSSSPLESCTEMCAVESHYVDCVPTW